MKKIILTVILLLVAATAAQASHLGANKFEERNIASYQKAQDKILSGDYRTQYVKLISISLTRMSISNPLFNNAKVQNKLFYSALMSNNEVLSNSVFIRKLVK